MGYLIGDPFNVNWLDGDFFTLMKHDILNPVRVIDEPIYMIELPADKRGVNMLVAIDKRGSVNIPSAIRKEMCLDTGTHLNLEVLDGGAIVLTPVAIYPTVKLSEKGLNKLKEARKSGTVKIPARLANQIENARTNAD